MTYEEDCRLRAQYLIDAANGVEFQRFSHYKNQWEECPKPRFQGELKMYRRKPTMRRYERYLLWLTYFDAKKPQLIVCDSEMAANCYTKSPSIKIHKREVVWVEVEA